MLKYLFPEYIKCLVCSDEIFDDAYFGFCEECYKKISFTSDYRTCKMCGRPILSGGNYEKCSECQKFERSFTCGYSCCIYEGLSEAIIMDFKYNDKSYLYKAISEIMIDKILDEEIEFDYIVYTPVHITRKWTRGFNQTKLLADYIGEELNKDVLEDLLIRKKMTKRLKKLSRRERESQLHSAFEINSHTDINGCNILLIDDIFTTGTTLNTCSQQLLNYGAANIKIITFAVKCNYDYNVYK